MAISSVLGRLLVFFALAGLLLVPVARAPLAAPMSMIHAMDADASGVAAAAKSGDMPCCPDTPALPDCGKDCPLMALCAAAAVPYLVQPGSLIVPHAVQRVMFAESEASLESLARAPPRRPPRI